MIEKLKKDKLSMMAIWRLEANDPNPLLQKVITEDIKIFYKGKDITDCIIAIEGVGWSGDNKFGSDYHELTLKIFED